MFVSSQAALAFHRAEIVRLSAALAAARPDSRQASLLRTTLRLHEEMVARAARTAD